MLRGEEGGSRHEEGGKEEGKSPEGGMGQVAGDKCEEGTVNFLHCLAAHKFCKLFTLGVHWGGS